MSLESISIEEKITYLMKKTGNVASTDSSLRSYNEPGIAARPVVLFQQVYREEVPSSAPSSGWLDANNQSITLNSLMDGEIATHDTEPLAYYKKFAMESVVSGRDRAFVVAPRDSNPLKRSIPHNFDPAGSYSVQLYFYDYTTTEIEFGFGEWSIDSDSGILTFYKHPEVSELVSADKPPLISFFSYTGGVGVPDPSPWIKIPDGLRYTADTVLIGQESSSGSGAFDLEVGGDSKFNGTLEADEIVCLSDAALKTDVQTLESPADKLQSLRGVSFRWKKGGGISHGIIAQELEAVLPGSTKSTPDGTLAANYNAVIALLVETVKNQEQRIRALEDNTE